MFAQNWGSCTQCGVHTTRTETRVEGAGYVLHHVCGACADIRTGGVLEGLESAGLRRENEDLKKRILRLEERVAELEQRKYA